jgi:hypothetical protein
MAREMEMEVGRSLCHRREKESVCMSRHNQSFFVLCSKDRGDQGTLRACSISVDRWCSSEMQPALALGVSCNAWRSQVKSTMTITGV